LQELKLTPHRVCIEGGRPIQEILQAVWDYLPTTGRVVATAANLESLYAISQSFSQLRARNIEVVQSAVNRLEMRGFSQTFAALDPIFILSGEKLE
jgi:cobalt-precorrin-6B (C15)-methyltransferase